MKINRVDLNPENLKHFLKNLGEILDKNEVDNFINIISNQKFVFNKIEIKSLLTNVLPIFGNFVYQPEIIPVKNYQIFINIARKKNNRLIEEEIDVSRDLIFEKTSHPLNYLKYFTTMQKKRGKLNGLFKDLMENVKSFFKLEDIRNVNTDFDLKFIQFLIKTLQKFRYYLDKKDPIGYFTCLKEFLDAMNLPKKKRSILTHNINLIINELKITKKENLKILNNPTEFGRELLRAINYTHSHIELFLKFIHRIVHILKYGNRNYSQIYYSLKSKKFKIKEFKIMINEIFKDEYPVLYKFLKKYVNIFFKLRNVNAHLIPKEITFSEDRKYLLVPLIGDSQEFPLNHRRIYTEMFSYSVFINKIDLHGNKKYHYLDDSILIID